VRGDLRAVLVAILTDPEARNFSPESGRLKDLVLHVIGLGRALGAQMSDPSPYNYLFSNFNQRVLTPTTVFGFYSPLSPLPGNPNLYGPEFQIYPPALALQRADFVWGLLRGNYGNGFTLNLAPYQALAATPAALVERVNQTMMFGRMSAALREVITVATNAVPATDTRERALGALFLAAVSSEQVVYSDTTGTGATSLQPPTGLVTTAVAGNVVTLRWTAPSIGPAATSYVFEGGVLPGQVLASIPTGSTAPTFTFTAPPGSFYVRIHSVAGGVKSRASSEVRIHVGVPLGPTAPANLLGMVRGNGVALSWRNTFGGGTPTSLILDVTGPVTVSLPLALDESFSFAGVPSGTYTLSMRAINAAGSSGSSNPVTLTFPTTCSGAPTTPFNFSATATGNVVSLAWQASVSGRASMSYNVNVTGAWTGRITTTSRTLTSSVAPGTYNISIQAVNPCGTSAATPVRTVTIP
jgi:hypothetical protein